MSNLAFRQGTDSKFELARQSFVRIMHQSRLVNNWHLLAQLLCVRVLCYMYSCGILITESGMKIIDDSKQRSVARRNESSIEREFS